MSRRSRAAASAFVFALIAIPRGGDARATLAAGPCTPVATIPAEPGGGLLFVPVHIDHHPEPVRMMFDSATAETYLFADKADALGLKRDGKASRIGVGEVPYEISFARGVSVGLGGVELAHQTLVVRAKPPRPPADGLIGFDILTRYVVGIDYERPALTLYDPRCDQAGPGRTIVPLTFEQDPRVPSIRGRLTMPGGKPVDGTFHVDTGAGWTAFFYRTFWEPHGLLGRARAISIRDTGGSGPVTTKMARAESVELGGYSVRGPVVGFFQHHQSGAGWDGLIGNDILRRFRVVLDYSRRRLILEPNGHLADPFRPNLTANWTGFVATDRKTEYLVTEVLDDSPASRAGMRAGDAVVAIDGRPIASITDDEWFPLLQQEGRTLVFEVRRGQESLKLPLVVESVL